MGKTLNSHLFPPIKSVPAPVPTDPATCRWAVCVLRGLEHQVSHGPIKQTVSTAVVLLMNTVIDGA